MNIDNILCRMFAGSTVSAEERAAVVTEVRARVAVGEKGADLPIALGALGVDYTAACEAVIAGDTAATLALLDAVEA